jgi:hypothetical protein
MSYKWIKKCETYIQRSIIQPEWRMSWALVAHVCNPSYSEGRDQENCGSSQPRQIVRETLSWKKLFTKTVCWSGSRCRPWVQTPQQPPKKQNEGQALWFILKNLATQEAEIGRSTGQGQLGKKFKTPSQPIKAGCGGLDMGSLNRRIVVQAGWT